MSRVQHATDCELLLGMKLRKCTCGALDAELELSKMETPTDREIDSRQTEGQNHD